MRYLREVLLACAVLAVAVVDASAQQANPFPRI
jgi:hypothetical protein